MSVYHQMEGCSHLLSRGRRGLSGEGPCLRTSLFWDLSTLLLGLQGTSEIRIKVPGASKSWFILLWATCVIWEGSFIHSSLDIVQASWTSASWCVWTFSGWGHLYPGRKPVGQDIFYENYQPTPLPRGHIQLTKNVHEKPFPAKLWKWSHSQHNPNSLCSAP